MKNVTDPCRRLYLNQPRLGTQESAQCRIRVVYARDSGRAILGFEGSLSGVGCRNTEYWSSESTTCKVRVDWARDHALNVQAEESDLPCPSSIFIATATCASSEAANSQRPMSKVLLEV